ncbi:MAG: hypothetical protein AAFO94_03815, partial [Bacteroidota bacterium]
MKQQPLTGKLLRLTGHLLLQNKTEQRQFKQLQTSLAQSLLPDDDSLLKSSDFSFEKADLFFEERIPTDRREQLHQLNQQTRKQARPPAYRVFVREVPLRERLLPNSVPAWAAGAKVDHSLGPFVNADGRQFWFDFFPIEVLVPLYIKNETSPALLFKTRRVGRGKPIKARPQKKFNLSAGSIWIQSRYLSPKAPDDRYTGLQLRKGSIELSKLATTIDGKLTIDRSTLVQLKLDLAQAEITDLKKRSKWGKAARNMELDLPDELDFQFSARGRKIYKVSTASAKIYGQSIQLDWNGKKQVQYDNVLQRIVFPLQSNANGINAPKNQSAFQQLHGAAPLQQTAWTLPAATIDINSPTEAQGNGALLLQTEAGLSAQWQG